MNGEKLKGQIALVTGAARVSPQAWRGRWVRLAPRLQGDMELLDERRGFRRGTIVRDPDGQAVAFVEPSSQ
jgi:hypothetical protein